MVVENSFRVHHYAPERRDESGTVVRTIEFRNAGDPYKRCKDEVDVIYNKVRKLLATVDTWLSNSLSDEITEEVVQSLYISFNKTMAVVSADVEELIITHGITNRRDLFEIRDVVEQLQEIADGIFEPHIKQ